MSLVPGEAPSYDDWKTRSTRAYGQALRGQLMDRSAGQRYRQQAYDRISSQTMAAENAIRDNTAGSLGFNQTPMTASLIAQVRQNAPYAAADLAARETARASTMATGQAIMEKKAANASWWTSMMQPFLQEESLKLQEQQIENAAAMGLAGMAGGGSSGSATTNAAIGAVGQLGAAALLAFG